MRRATRTVLKKQAIRPIKSVSLKVTFRMCFLFGAFEEKYPTLTALSFFILLFQTRKAHFLFIRSET